MSESIFIADLHLSAEQPELLRRFLDFLAGRAARADQLFILGDLFEVWLGDDLNEEPIPQIKAALRRLTDSGTRLYLMHGNRDFLIGDRFCNETGARLLPDPTLVELNGVRTLLMHGDLLCSDDVTYLQFRRQIRNPETIREFLAKPIPERIETARQIRAQSGEATSNKPDAIMDVNQRTVEEMMRKEGVTQLIHGHTHRPGRHTFELDGKPALRWVLADWRPEGSELLCHDQHGFHTETIGATP